MVRGERPVRDSRWTSQFAAEARKSMFSARWRFGSRKSVLATTIMREVSAAKRSSLVEPRVTEAARDSGGGESRRESKVSPTGFSPEESPNSVSPQKPSAMRMRGVGEIFRMARSSAFSRTSRDEDAPSKTAACPARSLRKGMPWVKFPRAVVVRRLPTLEMMRSRRGVIPFERRKIRRFGGHSPGLRRTRIAERGVFQ